MEPFSDWVRLGLAFGNIRSRTINLAVVLVLVLQSTSMNKCTCNDQECL